MLGLFVAKQFKFGRDRQSVPNITILAIPKCDDHLGHIIVAASRLDQVLAVELVAPNYRQRAGVDVPDRLSAMGDLRAAPNEIPVEMFQ
jgi:hypothetical protein